MIYNFSKAIKSLYFNPFQTVSQKCRELKNLAMQALAEFSCWFGESKKELSDYIFGAISSKSQRVIAHAKEVSDCLKGYGIFPKHVENHTDELLRAQKEASWFSSVSAKRQFLEKILLENPIVEGAQIFSDSFLIKSNERTSQLLPIISISWHVKSENNETVCCHFWGIKVNADSDRKRTIEFKSHFKSDKKFIQMTPYSGFALTSSYSLSAKSSIPFAQKIDEAYHPVPFGKFGPITSDSMRYNVVNSNSNSSYVIEIKKEAYLQERYFIIETIEDQLFDVAQESSLEEFIMKIMSKDSGSSPICEMIMKDLGIKPTKNEMGIHDD